MADDELHKTKDEVVATDIPEAESQSVPLQDVDMAPKESADRASPRRLHSPAAKSEAQAPVEPAPPDSDATHESDVRPLNVTDALSYLDSVKQQFQENPDVYNRFLDIMKDFKGQLIDTPGVIERVSNLFHGHPALIQGFNTFLPAGYRIECATDALNPNYITVTTPAGITTQATNAVFTYGNQQKGSSDAEAEQPLDSNVNLVPALTYVRRVQNRYANEPERYRRFLDIMMDKTLLIENDVRGLEPGGIAVAILSARRPRGDIVTRVADFFHDAPELFQEFCDFLSDEELEKVRKSGLLVWADGKPSRRKADGAAGSGAASSSALPQKRKRKPVDREKEREREKEKEKETASKASQSKTKRSKHQAAGNDMSSPSLAQLQVSTPPSPRRSAHAHSSQLPGHHQASSLSMLGPSAHHHAALIPADETHFFDRVKHALGNRETFNEFLKLVNLFTQDIIDTARLVQESRSFLGDGELMAQFRDILGWDERRERSVAAEDVWTRPVGVLDRPSRHQLNIRYGSYRKLPASEVNVTCSGRDEMCKSVLNDEWISQPTFSSEDSGFFTHRKNVYEEALHRSEEERHEYDFHIEAIHRTIQMLEPLNNKIAQLSPEERSNFKLKPNLGGAGKSIHQRIIKKIYGREAGVEAYQAMQEVPSLAIPVVLTRLKQKHEEWKRAQREWNKVWREVDAKNYHKSLDHQGLTFKAADKKAITPKSFVNQIETARDEQMAHRASLIDPLFARTRPRHQLEFLIDDFSVLQDALKLTLSFLDRTQGQIAFADRKKIETFLRSFVPLFFMLNPMTFNAAFVPHQEIVDSDMEVDSVADDTELASVSSSSKTGRSNKKGGFSGDLRKKLLKSEQAKFSRRTRAQDTTPSHSRMVSPAASDAMQIDEDSAGANGELLLGLSTASVNDKHASRRRGSFFTNTNFYVLLRLLELLYTRLHLCKDIAMKLARTTFRPDQHNPIAAELGLVHDPSMLSEKTSNAARFYDAMLESCEKLFDNDIEQAHFEDQLRSMFGTKHAYKMFTVDKVVGALIKQVQSILLDSKSQELFDLLRRERDIPSPTTQDMINSRRNTEKVIGPDENLFRMDWLPDSHTVTVQLLGKDDSSFDDSEVLTGRWQAYIESFVTTHYTEGVPTSASTLRRPFLRRTKVPPLTGEPDVIARGGLEIKVCVRTYRLFFVSNTEDFLWRISTQEEHNTARKLLDAKNARRKAWVENLSRSGDEGAVAAPSSVENTATNVSPAQAQAANAQESGGAATSGASTSNNTNVTAPTDMNLDAKSAPPAETVVDKPPTSAPSTSS